uniref:HNH endonuclease family protein n=1 Tax=Cyanothece sp. BG0011 TaxID=2082950 RepID=UPI00130086F0
KPDSQWCKDWTEADRDKWVHRLGNLVLLSRKKNSAARNYDFEEKKSKYFKEGNTTIFPLTIDVVNQEQWTIKQVKDKQEKYVKKLTELWKIEYSNVQTQLSNSMEIEEIEQAELLLKQLREKLVQQ